MPIEHEVALAAVFVVRVIRMVNGGGLARRTVAARVRVGMIVGVLMSVGMVMMIDVPTAVRLMRDQLVSRSCDTEADQRDNRQPHHDVSPGIRYVSRCR